MKQIVALLIGSILFISPALAEAPCDFKGVSVGSKMSPAEIMSALGVTQIQDKVPLLFFRSMALAENTGSWRRPRSRKRTLGRICDDGACIVLTALALATPTTIPVKVIVSFHDGQITEIVVSFGTTFWDEMLPILEEKYGADWKVEREIWL